VAPTTGSKPKGAGASWTRSGRPRADSAGTKRVAVRAKGPTALAAEPHDALPSNEQGRGRDHSPRDERGQAREQQKVIHHFGHGSLPRCGQCDSPVAVAHPNTVAERWRLGRVKR